MILLLDRKAVLVEVAKRKRQTSVKAGLPYFAIFRLGGTAALGCGSA